MKVSFLFGAGAEIGYGLPSGGKFALDIFRQDTTKAKDKFKEIRNSIDTTTNYAGKWLPKDYVSKNVSSFGRSVLESIVKGTLEHNREKVIKKINSFDEIAEEEKYRLESKYDVEKYIQNLIGRSIHECNMSQSISFSQYIEEGNGIFESHWFSALLILYKENKLSINTKNELKKVLNAVVQLQLGALGEDFTHKFNESLFNKKDDTIDFLDDIGDIFYLNYKSAGLSGLEYIMDRKEIDTNSEENAFLLFIENILENIYAYVLDYKTLIDSYWHYLYCPNKEWAKFCKINIFLNTVQQYIAEQCDENNNDNQDGYYNDVHKFKDKMEIKAIATTNYNMLIKEITKENVYFLNGSTDIYYDPYLNRIGSKDELNKFEKHFIVPLLFTQSGTKPMTSINMLQLYVDVYNKFKESDIIFIVGFGFNPDDEHINGIIRTLIDIDHKKVKIVDVNKNLKLAEIADKLKIKQTNNIEIIIVDEKRYANNNIWLNDCLEN